MAEERPLGLNTKALHAGYTPDPTTGARAVPIYQTTSFAFRDSGHAAALFALEEQGNIYTRIMNPTTDVLEQRVAALEGGVGALALASGQAASTYSLLTIASAGHEVISSHALYGGTYNLFHYTLPKLGVKVRFVDFANEDEYRAAFTDRTRAVYGEMLGNPKLNVLDVERVASVAHDNGVPLVVDATCASPALVRPIEWGADIVMHSLTKFLGGHGTSIGGIVVDSGRFDWANGRFPEMVEPDPSYHGLKYVEALGELAYIVKMRVTLLRDFGACISPFNAFMVLQGIETLGARMERHSRNALQVAQWLSDHPRVTWVNYPGLPDHPSHDLAGKYLPEGQGALVGFGIEGGPEAGRKFIDGVELLSHLANIGDARTLVIHPASTTHQQLTPEEQELSGVTGDYVRLSIGLEDVDDIIADIDQALAQV